MKDLHEPFVTVFLFKDRLHLTLELKIELLVLMYSLVTGMVLCAQPHRKAVLIACLTSAAIKYVVLVQTYGGLTDQTLLFFLKQSSHLAIIKAICEGVSVCIPCAFASSITLSMRRFISLVLYVEDP